MHRHTTNGSDVVHEPGHASISWIGPAPADDDTRTVWDCFAAAPVVDHAWLVERVADRLFRRDLDTVGAVADVGFFRRFYLPHARRLIAALDGTLLRIERTT